MRNKGYSLVELLVILSLIGLVAVIASPSFLGFYQRQRVGTAAGVVYQVLLLAKSNANREKVDYSIDFRRDFDGFSYCLRPSVSQCNNWQSLRGVYLARCTFPSNGQNFVATRLLIGGMCTAHFSWMGAIQGRLGGVYLKANAESSYCRGVWTKTLLGVLDNREVDKCED